MHPDKHWPQQNITPASDVDVIMLFCELTVSCSWQYYSFSQHTGCLVTTTKDGAFRSHLVAGQSSGVPVANGLVNTGLTIDSFCLHLDESVHASITALAKRITWWMSRQQ